MNVFISWSGTRSHALADALRDWLPLIMNEVKPFLSSSDIEKGQRWNSEVASRLDSSDVGIICVTPASLHSDWLLFETGALAKKLVSARVCPLLVDLKKSDVTGPLSQFQMSLSTKEEIRKLVTTINKALGDKTLEEKIVSAQFECGGQRWKGGLINYRQKAVKLKRNGQPWNYSKRYWHWYESKGASEPRIVFRKRAG